MYTVHVHQFQSELHSVSILKVLVETRGSVQRSSQDSSLAVSWHIFRRYSQYLLNIPQKTLQHIPRLRSAR
ncbi:hypothetical protein GBAR_LOCUS13197 [Geodia barretti]|uniref:Uncharacterized protein n=1 Tax=Geodia barretti TaxID=519541 RepID=A0AA35WMM7_GEOBA|nr:hypothetical protein GBAR_LOCUS13197 [Geodia barretti]